MNTVSTPYEDQLNNKVRAQRLALESEYQRQQAARNTGLTGREAAAHDKWNAYKLFLRNNQAVTVTTLVAQLATRAQLMAGNLGTYAGTAQDDATTATTAMADAAAGIKAAANALEALTSAVHGIAAITEANDRPDPVNQAAAKAGRAVEDVMREADRLKNLSLDASIAAAQTQAGVLALTVSLLGDQIGTVAADAATALSAVTQATGVAYGNRTSTWGGYYSAVAPFERASLKVQALHRSLHEIDRVANGSLRVEVANSESGAGLRARMDTTVSAENDPYEAPLFYAVPQLDAATFRYTDSLPPAPPTEGHGPNGYSALLTRDFADQEIAYGTTYYVFSVRIPKAGSTPPPKSLPNEGRLAAKQLPAPDSELTPAPSILVSLPSLPIRSVYTFKENIKPQVTLFPDVPSFMVTFDLGLTEQVEALRQLTGTPELIIVPQNLWLRQTQDETYLTSQVNAANFTALHPVEVGVGTNVEEEIEKEIAFLYNRDLQVLKAAGIKRELTRNHFVQELWSNHGQSEQNFASQNPRSIAVVHFSPVPPPREGEPGSIPLKNVTFGFYSDMMGDFIDLSQSAYCAAVLVRGAQTEGGSVLSPASEAFGEPTPGLDQPAEGPSSNRPFGEN